METKIVDDLTVPLSDYAKVSVDSTLQAAVREMVKARERYSGERSPHMEKLIYNKKKNIIGKIGFSCKLKPFELGNRSIKEVVHVK